MKRILTLLAISALVFPTPALASTAKTKLTIKADLADGAGVRTWTLNCDFSVGNHPNRNAACALLKKKGVAIFKPVPSDAICTEVYGGPERVSVSGIVARKKVDTVFTRNNGCEITRYQGAEAIFTIPNTQVLRGTLTLDGAPIAGPVVFTSGNKSVATKATDTGFAIRLGAGSWMGSAGVGRTCLPVNVTVPVEPLPLTISCTSTKS